MKHKVIRTGDVIRKKWSGGISSQYYIYPEGADRSTGEYAFIVTSATVELEESTFSDYTGFDRVIMSLTEAYDLIHNDTDTYHLQPFEPHAFTGEEKTVSKGVYTDCNLIMKRACAKEKWSRRCWLRGAVFSGRLGTHLEKRRYGRCSAARALSRSRLAMAGTAARSVAACRKPFTPAKCWSWRTLEVRSGGAKAAAQKTAGSSSAVQDCNKARMGHANKQ